jgi:dCMP deaminase
MRPSRDLVYLRMAHNIATRGTCARRQVGCILVDEDGFVLSMGYNGVAAGRPHCSEGNPCPGAFAPSGELLDACQALHAEQNAILRLPDPRKVHTAYCTVSPCISCVKLLLGTAARRIVFSDLYPHTASREWWEAAGRDWVHLIPMGG